MRRFAHTIICFLVALMIVTSVSTAALRWVSQVVAGDDFQVARGDDFQVARGDDFQRTSGDDFQRTSGDDFQRSA